MNTSRELQKIEIEYVIQYISFEPMVNFTIVGYGEEQFIGLRTWLNKIHEDDRAIYRKHLEIDSELETKSLEYRVFDGLSYLTVEDSNHKVPYWKHSRVGKITFTVHPGKIVDLFHESAVSPKTQTLATAEVDLFSDLKNGWLDNGDAIFLCNHLTGEVEFPLEFQNLLPKNSTIHFNIETLNGLLAKVIDPRDLDNIPNSTEGFEIAIDRNRIELRGVPDSQFRWIHFTIQHFSEGSSKKNLCALVFENITLVKRDQEKLKSMYNRFKQKSIQLKLNNKRLEKIIETISDTIYDVDFIKESVYIPTRFETMLGYEPGELGFNYQTWRSILSDLVHPEDHVIMVESLLSFQRFGKDKFTSNYRLRQKNGDYLWVRSQGSFSADPKTGKTRKMIGAFTNIQALKEVEQQLQKTTYDLLHAKFELEKSEERLRLVLDSSNDGFYDLDISNDITYASPGYYKLLKINKEEKRIDYDLFVELLHPADKVEALQAYDDALLEKGGQYVSEYRIRQSDGNYVWVQDRGRIISDPDTNRPLRSVGVMENITARKKAEFEMLQARKAAEEANKAKDIFLAQMSHELRTPLNAILGYSQILESESYIKQKDKESLQTVSASGNHLLALINDILQYARNRSIKSEVILDVIQTDALFKELKTLFGKKAIYSNNVFELKIAKNVPEGIISDQRKIKQILINLLGNALKFTTNGKVILAVRVLSQAGKTIKLHFSIKDNGIGIPKGKVQTILEPFTQLNPSKYPGTGLGLTITQELIELLDGQMGISSSEGEGTEVSFILPVEYYQLKEQKSSEQSPFNADRVGTGQKILIIDDLQQNLDLLSKVVGEWGFQPICFTSVQAGLDYLKSTPADLVLLDLILPEKNGFDFLKEFYLNDHYPTTPVIAVSASVFPEDVDKALQLGASYFLSKPLDFHELKKVLIERLNLNIPEESKELSAPKMEELANDSLSKEFRNFLSKVETFAETGNLSALRTIVDEHAPTYSGTRNFSRIKDFLQGYRMRELRQFVKKLLQTNEH